MPDFLFRKILYFSLLLILAPVQAATDGFRDYGQLTRSWQFDAEIDQQGILHLISDQYYQFDLSGELLTAETEAGDQMQFNIAYPPAISIDPGGNVHMLTRGEGNFTDGVEINYRVRNSDGSWQEETRNYLVDPPEGRNNLLGLAALSETEIYAHHGVAGENVWGDLRFLRLDEAKAENLGRLGNIWRADLDTRMRADNGLLYFASANALLSNDIFFSISDGGDDLLDELEQNMQTHNAGNDSQKRGNPDIAIDRNGAAHLVYGAYQEVYYNRYSAEGEKILSEDIRILENLGSWHLSFGMAAVGASEDGSVILVAGLKTDGNKLANNSEILLTWSTDGGNTWRKQIATGRITHGGEGRMRPRILTYGDRFYLIYYDATLNGLAMAGIDTERLSKTDTTSPLPDIVQLLLLE